MSTSNISLVSSEAHPAAGSTLDAVATAATAASDDPVPAEVHAVIDLFASHLAKVAFPDIDASTLRRLADELRVEAATVARARDALDAALAAFAARRTALGDTAARAVAYARIYSEAHAERTALAAAITALSEPRPAGAAGAPIAGKRRGRPPKRSAELFDAATPVPDRIDPA